MLQHADVEFAMRLQRVYEAAVHAIEKLGVLDLVKYEESPLDASADLSLWETVAPLVASTLADVNALLLEMRAQFPESAIVIDPTENEIDRLIQQSLGELQGLVIAFGRQVRDPSVVGDRWNLAGELQNVRSAFRQRIGRLVFETAQQLGDCRRGDVDPSHVDAVSSAVVIRSTGADLSRLMIARIQKVNEAELQDTPWHAAQIEKELDAFGRTAAWRLLQAAEKKAVLEFRNEIRAIANAPPVEQQLLTNLLVPFTQLVARLEGDVVKSLLREHDQEVRAQVGVALEQALAAATFDGAVAAFGRAAQQAQSLYGRNGEFDVFLRKVKRTVLSEESLPIEVEVFLMLLGTLEESM